VRAAGRFAAGFLLGYGVHFTWFATDVGYAVERVLPSHAANVLSLFTDASFQAGVLQAGDSAVRIVPGCTSGPAVVLLAAVFFLLHMGWWKKTLAVVVGYLPAFYLYHLARLIALTLALGGVGKQESYLYNFFGITLVIAYAFAVHGVYVCRRLGWWSWKEHLLRLGFAAVAGGAVAWAVGVLNRALTLPMLLHMVSGRPDLVWDVKHTLSHMADFSVFVWVTLVLLDRTRTTRGKRRLVTLGIVAGLAHAWLVAGVVQAAGLQPMYAALKLWTVALPFLAYLLFVHRPDAPEASEAAGEASSDATAEQGPPPGSGA
jgi:hypothetical protein